MHDVELRAVEIHAFVRIVEAAQRLGDDAELHGERQLAAVTREDGREGLPIEVLHDDHGAAAGFGDLVGLRDVGVIQRAQRAAPRHGTFASTRDRG